MSLTNTLKTVIGNPSKQQKQVKSFYLTKEATDKLDLIKNELHLSQTSFIEYLIRSIDVERLKRDLNA